MNIIHQENQSNLFLSSSVLQLSYGSIHTGLDLKNICTTISMRAIISSASIGDRNGEGVEEMGGGIAPPIESDGAKPYQIT